MKRHIIQWSLLAIGYGLVRLSLRFEYDLLITVIASVGFVCMGKSFLMAWRNCMKEKV
jgi:hypothetical protein